MEHDFLVKVEQSHNRSLEKAAEAANKNSGRTE